MHGSVTIHFKKRFADALLVPSSCVIGSGLKRPWVYVVRDGEAHRLGVEVAADNGTQAEISKGIKASDLIISNNHNKLTDGTPVKVEKGP